MPGWEGGAEAGRVGARAKAGNGTHAGVDARKQSRSHQHAHSYHCQQGGLDGIHIAITSSSSACSVCCIIGEQSATERLLRDWQHHASVLNNLGNLLPCC